MASNSNEVTQFVSFPSLTEAVDEWIDNKPKLKLISPDGINDFCRDWMKTMEVVVRPTLDTISKNTNYNNNKLIELDNKKREYWKKLSNQESRLKEFLLKKFNEHNLQISDEINDW
eukprot:265649_1